MKRSASTVLEGSFEEVVDQCYEKIFNIAFRYTDHPEEARELTQEVFVRAYQSFPRFRGDSSVSTWLYRIATNLCLNRVKQLRRRTQLVGESLDELCDRDGDEEGRTWEIPDRTHSPEEVLESEEMRRVVQGCMQVLPPDYRMAVVLRDIEGLSYQKIAKITCSTSKAVKSRLFRARTALRELLRPHLYPQEGQRP